MISREEAERLSVEGCVPEPIGLELQPPRLILFAPDERVSRMGEARAIPVRLSAELLAAEGLALVRFECAGPGGSEREKERTG